MEYAFMARGRSAALAACALVALTTSGCSQSLGDIGTGIRDVRSIGHEVRIIVDLYDPIDAIDLPIAAGGYIVAIGHAMRHHAREVPENASIVTILFTGVDTEGHRRAWSTVSLPASRLRVRPPTDLDARGGLDLVHTVRFASSDAASVARDYCGDPARARASPLYCAKVAALT